MTPEFVFTSESVTAGHPDKLCDQISDAIVGRYLRQDPLSRVVAECAVSTGIVFIAVKAASVGSVDIPSTARQVITDVGYCDTNFNARTSTVMTSLAETTDSGEERLDEALLDAAELDRLPARNQATVFGFACNQTAVLMPLPIWLAHRLARRLSDLHDERDLAYLAPDGKVQVGVEFRHRRPYRVSSLTVVASQNEERPKLERLRDDLRQRLIEPAFADQEVRPDERTRIAINPEGPVVGGGPTHHSGLTGRKTAVDTYGEYSRHSGAALSGKDPSRIDRVGAYAARHAAKNIVAAGLASECEVILSYAIGLAEPVSIQIETFGTGQVEEEEILRRLRRHCDFRPAAIVRRFDLRLLPGRFDDGFYRKLSAYGHVGREDLDLPWERLDLWETLAGDRGLERS